MFEIKGKKKKKRGTYDKYADVCACISSQVLDCLIDGLLGNLIV